MPFSLRERTLNTKYRRNRSDKNIVPQYVESYFENKIILNTNSGIFQADCRLFECFILCAQSEVYVVNRLWGYYPPGSLYIRG